MWRLSSMGSGNETMAPPLDGAYIGLPYTKPSDEMDFNDDPVFNAFDMFDQNDDRFGINNLGIPSFMAKDSIDLSMMGHSSVLESSATKNTASLVPSPQDVRIQPFSHGPPQPPWMNPDCSTNNPTKASEISTFDTKNTFGSRPMQCDCLKVTLSLLENVHFREPHATAATLIHLLHQFKQWTNLFNGVVSCTLCNCLTESSMLLIVICEKLADSFEIVLNVYEKLAEAVSSTSSGTSEMRSLSGEYSIDSLEEFACLFKSLALRHLQSLHIITLFLSKNPVRDKPGMHHELLRRLEDRHHLMKETVRRASLEGGPGSIRTRG